MEQRVTIFTIRVEDLEAATRYYVDVLNWPPLLAVPGEVAFLQVAPGVALSLFEANGFDADAGQSLGFPFTLAQLLTTVLNVPYRRNGVLLAKQLASVDRLSGGRLTAGLALGGWPEDHGAVGPSTATTGELMDDMLATMRAAWSGKLSGASGPMPAMPAGRPRLLFGGFSPAAYRRAAAMGEGWVAPSFGFEPLIAGVSAVSAAWGDAGRTGRPTVVVERYFSLGADADDVARHYLHHYYGEAYLEAVLADTPTSVSHLASELERLLMVGCDDVVLFPCTADIQQVELLASALDAAGFAVSASAAAST